MVSERELLQWIATRAPIGDDCAVLECGSWGTLLAEEGPRALG